MAKKPTYEELEQRVKGLEKESFDWKQEGGLLRKREQKLEELLSVSPVATYRCEPKDTFPATFITENVRNQLGYEPYEFTERSDFWSSHIHPDDAPHILSNLTNLLETGSHAHEYRFLHKDGTYRWMYDELRLIYDVDGKPTDIVGNWMDITDRKQAEEALQESEERYRGVFENSTDFVYTLDLKGSFTDVNKAAESLTGYTKKELIGMNYRDYAAADSHEKIFQAFHRIFEEGEPLQDFPLEVTVKDGAKKYFEASVGPLRKGGKIIGFHGTSRDITHRVHSEQALRRSEERYRTILDSIEEAYFEVDITGNFTFFNDSLSKILGYSNDELAEMNNRDYMPPESSRKIYDLFNQIYNTGNPIKKVAYEIVRKDGGHGFHELSASLMKDQTGRPIGFRGIAHDITDFKKAREALRDSEGKYRSILASIEDGYYELDIAGNFTFCNDSTCRILGCPNNELMGSNNREYMDQETAKNVYQKYNRVYTTGKADKGLQYELTRKDGAKIYVDASVSLMKDEEGQPIGFRGIVRDITERKKLETQFIQAQKIEAVGVLAGGVAHDFNNLLSIVIGHTDLMLMDLAEDHPFRKDLEQIKGGAKSAARLTRQLLAFSRKQILQPVVLDLNELIKGFAKMLERLIGEDVELKTVLVSGLRRVEADPGQMEQVIMNLVINARDAMPDGGKVIIETVNADLNEDYTKEHDISLQPGPYVMLAVSDTGIGMDEETRSHIFEPFFTTKEVGKGTGLGLSTVYGIVKQSGGYIYVYSDPGQGSTFKIHLPAVEGAPVQVQKEKLLAGDLTGSETILIVEDDNALRNLGRKILEPQGYRILEAENGIEALRIGQEQGGQIHLMITDVVMPKMGGKEAADLLQPLYPRMKVIYMSGYTDNSIAHHGILGPELNFLQKPFSPEILARKVREVLDKKQD